MANDKNKTLATSFRVQLIDGVTNRSDVRTSLLKDNNRHLTFQFFFVYDHFTYC
jgi:hypothetical protein